jgi:hypothetical protein
LPIIERTPQACFDRFRGLLAKLVASTIAKSPVVRCTVQAPQVAMISFVQGEDLVSAPIRTSHGTLRFHFGQLVEAVALKGADAGKYQLRTLEYRYRIQEAEGPRAPALVRWEYTRADPSVAGHPRHHIHLLCRLPVAGAETIDLDKKHLSTGWVTIEEVIRFIIHELGHKPPCGARWPKVLADSEGRFFGELSSKGCPHAVNGRCSRE